MKILSQKREGNKVFFEIEEDYSRFEENLEKAIVEAGREINVPGFRPGKAPRDMVERAVDRGVIEHRAAQKLVADIYSQIIDESRTEPVDYPSIEIVQQEPGKPFIFKFSVEVYPEVKLGKYKGIKLEKNPVEVSEEELLAVLGRLQDRFAVQNAEGEKQLLPLDDDFAKKISQHGTLAEFKEELRRMLLDEKTAEAEADLKNRAIATASAEASVDIPAAMIGREIDLMLDELKTSLAQSNLTLDDYLKGAKKEEKALREEMKKAAEVRVKGKLVLKAVAEAEKMEVAPEELQAELKAMADSMGEKVEQVEQRIEEGGKKYIEDYLLRKKSLDLILEKASVKENIGGKK